MNKISIVFITDNNYVTPTIVTITSLLKNKEKLSKYDIYVLGYHLTPTNKHLLEKQGAEVIESEVRLPEFNETHPYVSVAALLKFDLPNILKKLDKVLYLDTDMIILKDLSALFNTDLTEKYAAVVKDMAGMKIETCHNLLNHKNYFNSGMMLLNLKKMRKDKIAEKLVDYKLHQDTRKFMDQDCLNAVFQENVIYVSPIYNWMAPNQTDFTTKEINEFYGLTQDLTLKNAVIVHLTNKNKAWNYVDTWGHKLWKKYYEKSILKGIKRHYQNNSEIVKREIKPKKWFGWKGKNKADHKQKTFKLFGLPIIKIEKYPNKKEIKFLNLTILRITRSLVLGKWQC